MPDADGPTPAAAPGLALGAEGLARAEVTVEPAVAQGIQALDHAAGQSARRQRTGALEERWRRAAVELTEAERAEEVKAIIKGIITRAAAPTTKRARGVTLSLDPGLNQNQGITGFLPRSLGTRIGKELRVMKRAEGHRGHTGQSLVLVLGHKRPLMLICRGGLGPNLAPVHIQNLILDPAHGLGHKTKCCPFLPCIPLLKSTKLMF